MTWNKYSRFWALVTLLWCIGVFVTACTTTWVSEATNIIDLLVPAITAALGILTAFGAGISPNALTDIQDWGVQANNALQTVKGLIDQYNTAQATAQPGILTEIQSALNVIVQNLSTVLPEIHVTNPATEAKILAVINAVASELQALINVVPALQGKITSHDQLKELMAQVKSASEFRKEFNSLADSFGKQYEI